ncbi:hypothetical protein XI09_13005 [Bradyrhizobium sp. CCBAU 11386]|nr:hypothetical protein [Bradyrhizobium sp. CCBAU 11386]
MPATGYELVNLYLTYNATRDIVFTASINNLLNQYYRPYAIPGSSTDGTTQKTTCCGRARDRDASTTPA